MNIVILDGTINSHIERVLSDQRYRVRFTLQTTTGDNIAVEARGVGAEKLEKAFHAGDSVHLRGRINGHGYVAADYIRRGVDRSENRTTQLRWPFCSTTRDQEPSNSHQQFNAIPAGALAKVSPACRLPAAGGWTTATK